MSPKSFAVLAGAAALSLGLAAWAVVDRDVPVVSAPASQALFPRLLDHVNDVRAVKLVTPDGPLTVQGADGVHWTLAEKGGYPVEQKQIRDLVLALANLQLLEAKTDDPKLLKRLELEEPGAEGAKSRSVTLDDTAGKPLAAAVVGKPKPGLYGGGRGGVYVRRAGDNQAWLAAGELDLPSDALALLNHEVIDIPQAQVARVTLQPAGGEPILLQRPDAKTTAFTTDAPLPEGRALDSAKVEELAGTLANLTLEDVKPASALPVPADASHARFETFDGLVVDVTLVRVGDGDAAENWLELAVQPIAGGQPMKEAEALKTKTDGWAYKVGPYLADRLRGGLDQLLASPPGAS